MTIRPMTKADVAEGMRLKDSAGWNQLEADWLLLLRANPGGSFCMVCEERIVGTITTVNYHDRLSWIGMVLVDPAYRRTGIATRLVNTALESLASCTGVKLDATPEGREVYARLGFIDEYAIIRMVVGAVPAIEIPEKGVEPVTAGDLDEIVAFDTPRFGVERRSVLAALVTMDPTGSKVLRRKGEVVAACFSRPGANMMMIGPVIAETESDAKAVVSAALTQQLGGPVVMDVPGAQPDYLGWLTGLGFARQREFTRMLRGDNVVGIPSQVFAVTGPEFG